ncbi:MAG TPA: type II secretion system protein GspE [Firmicutes bacterium]|nr:type II secretion system protein GspE [Bacillota bacterium]
MANPGLKRLGDLLVDEGVLSPQKLEEALKTQRASGKRLGEVLQELELVVESQILDALANQLGVQKIDLGSTPPDPEIAALVDPEVIKRHKALPVKLEGNNLIVAMVDPLNLMAIDDIRLATGYDVKPYICSEKALDMRFQELFGVSHEASQHLDEWRKEMMKDGNTIKELLKKTATLTELEDAPIVRFVEAILEGAVDQNASDVHLEPKEDKLHVRYRVDGMLYRVMTVPKAAQAAVIARLKILAGLDTSERRRPMDGRIDLKVRNASFDIRFSTLPTMYGEKIVMRLLNKEMAHATLSQLGFEEDELNVWKDIINKPHGIIYLTGPTGSGKSTTLIASLATIANEKINVVTIEDPIEYQLPTINQVQVNRKVDFSFAEALRTILRQDPDVIMVGETRDRETADLAINAALTGHLVFSTLHTNDSAGGLIRLNNMGVERFLIVASVEAMVAQRLLRTLCKNCRKKYELDPHEYDIVKPYLGADRDPAKLKLYRAQGCEMCHNYGYSGRTAVCEILQMTRDIRNMIMANASVQDIKRQARREGMNTLFESGMKKVFKGQTSIEELFRIARPEEDEDSSTSEKAGRALLEELPEELYAA